MTLSSKKVETKKKRASNINLRDGRNKNNGRVLKLEKEQINIEWNQGDGHVYILFI